MVAVKLGGNLELMAVATPAYWKCHGLPEKPRDLHGHRCINFHMPTDGIPYRWEFERGWQTIEVAVEGPLVTNDVELVLRAALDGVGVAYLFDQQVRSWFESGDATGGSASATGTRKNVAVANGSLTERGLRIAGVVKDLAAEAGRTPAQVAIAWTLQNPAVTSPIIGARTVKQLEDNLGALDVRLTDAQRRRLEEVNAVELAGLTEDQHGGGERIAARHAEALGVANRRAHEAER